MRASRSAGLHNPETVHKERMVQNVTGRKTAAYISCAEQMGHSKYTYLTIDKVMVATEDCIKATENLECYHLKIDESHIKDSDQHINTTAHLHSCATPPSSPHRVSYQIPDLEQGRWSCTDLIPTDSFS